MYLEGPCILGAFYFEIIPICALLIKRMDVEAAGPAASKISSKLRMKHKMLRGVLMRKRSIILSGFMVIMLLAITTTGCQKVGQQQTNTNTSSKNPHVSGAIDLSQFPVLKDKTIVEQAIKNMAAMTNYKLIYHTTGKKGEKVTADSDFEVTYVSPDQVYFFGDDNLEGKRQEIYQLGDIEYKSFDGVKWTRTTKPLPKYNFTPETIQEMFKQGKNFHLVGDNREIDQYKSCTVVIFERSSNVYRGQTEQIDFWIDNSTKNIVRIEILNNEKKPSEFREEFLRFFDYNSPDLKIELPAGARAAN